MLVRRMFLLLMLLLLVSAGNVCADVHDTVPSFIEERTYHSRKDTATMCYGEVKPIEIDTQLVVFKPDPMRAVWMGAIIPGYGQIYNRKYWKLPIVYGGFLGCAYAISWTGTRYVDYKTAYRDIIDNDPTSNSFMDILPEGYTLESLGGISQYSRTLQTRQNTFRRYRDLSIIISVVFYALTLVDAYVDAQLYDFDISPDLSMYITPGILEYGEQDRQKAASLQLTINF